MVSGLREGPRRQLWGSVAPNSLLSIAPGGVEVSAGSVDRARVANRGVVVEAAVRAVAARAEDVELARDNILVVGLAHIGLVG